MSIGVFISIYIEDMYFFLTTEFSFANSVEQQIIIKVCIKMLYMLLDFIHNLSKIIYKKT